MENLSSDSDILDLAIAGGGPAGTAAALEARRHGLQVAIWDRDHFPRDKVCGEFISPEGLPLLQTEIPEYVARGAPIHRAEFISQNGLSRVFRLPGPAAGLSRLTLDAALWGAAKAAGIEVHESECVRRVRKLAPVHGQARVWEIESTGPTVRRAKALIIACGRWWRIEGLSSSADETRPAGLCEWIGAKAHFAGISPQDRVEMCLFNKGYCGLAPVEGDIYNVCCLVRRERIRGCGGEGMKDFSSWIVKLSHHPALEARLSGAAQVSPVVTTAPVYLMRGKAAQEGALMVGDASGFLDPFTGEGISMALHSGKLAAQAIAKSLQEGRSEEQTTEYYRESLTYAVRRSYKIAALVRGLLHRSAWVQGLATAPLLWVGRRIVRETRWREIRS